MESPAASRSPPPSTPTPPAAAAAAASADPPAQEPPAANHEEGVVADTASEKGEEEEEEEGECGFCLFMKGGGCKEEFVAWEKCVEVAEANGGDVVERCFEATAALRKCMDAHADYYEPILRAERAMAEDIEAQRSDPPETPPKSEKEVASEKS